MKNFTLIWIFVLIISSLVVAGTTGKIVGRVVDATSNEPLIGVNLIVEGTRIGAATDEEGFYLILNVPPGSYNVIADYIGYGSLTKTGVRVKIDMTTTLNFEMSEAVLRGETVTVIAERPIVEIDLTATKRVVTSQELAESWVETIPEKVKTLSGVNIHGGIRGTFDRDVVYFVDGQELRDAGANINYTGINKTAVSEMEVLSGGYNAEYGLAQGSVINIVTKRPTDRFHGTFRYSIRPAGVYHWGRNMFSKDNYEWAVMATRDYWDPNSTYIDWDGTEKSGHDGGGSFADKTPDERLDAWKRFISGKLNDELDVSWMQDYADRAQWLTEATIYGPITSKLGFMASGRWHQGVSKYPSLLKYNPEWNFMGKLYYNVTQNTLATLSLMHGGFDNSGASRSSYYTNEDTPHRTGGGAESGYIHSYESNKYWPFGTSHRGQSPPTYQRMYSGQLRITHTFSPKTFLDASISHLSMDTDEHFRDIIPWEWYQVYPEPDANHDFWSMVPQNSLFNPTGIHTVNGHYQLREVTTRNTALRADLTSQIHPKHLVKGGVYLSYQYFKRIQRWGWEEHLQYDDYYKAGVDFNPYEGAAYIQDKFESKGLIINYGLRFDFFNANKKVSDTVWDPLRINPFSPGNDSARVQSLDPDGPYAVKTKTRFALSPRIGISHPITENAVLHFMYGHFVQRPSWKMIAVNPSVQSNWKEDDGWVDETKPDGEGVPENSRIWYRDWDYYANPALSYERTIQYEIGIDQNIADLIRLDVTMYYKDGKGLTSVGQLVGGRLFQYGTTQAPPTIRLYPDAPGTVEGGPTDTAPGGFYVYSNGGYLDSRGLEFDLNTTLFQGVNVQVIYNLAWVYTNRYGFRTIFQEWDGQKIGQDARFGISNTDGGISGNDNDRWQASNTFKLLLTLSSPSKFGPALGSFYPFGDWRLNTYTVYSSGFKYTYHAPGDLSSEVNNETWDSRWETNIRLARMVDLIFNTQVEFTLDVRNLFNQKYLNPLSGDDLTRYKELDILPVHSVTGENMTWTYYDANLMPREIIFGINFMF